MGFDLEEVGAALLEGWSDEGAWRVLLPWPEEVRELAWSDAPTWKRELDLLEASIAVRDAPFFDDCWVGFITYEAMATEEDAAPRDENPPEPAMFFARHRKGIVIDPRGEVSVAFDGTSEIRDSLGGGAYARTVERIRDAIRDGDVYQVNLTRAFSTARRGDAQELYLALTGSLPPRMSALIRGPRCVIASASPEVLLKLDRVSGVAETRPIKGTIRREGDDAREIATLLGSEKDAAEHLMIVDVSRNDLGKIAPPGEVRVTDYRRVRTLEHVHHLESTIEATGLRDRRLSEIVGALSPAASITGAPKRAAVQLIREIEPVPRGVYCGSIGFIGPRFVELSVAIRTAVLTENEMRYHAGGGIVWDSRADDEDDETRAKSAAFLRYAGVRP
ncbi:MAG TPA: anthranilate synthase component I family protein [Thermoanaerobaculia bacterium]|nr:anthranilate synthase component I family protein [Thermoanaerobaculia bacterium]